MVVTIRGSVSYIFELAIGGSFILSLLMKGFCFEPLSRNEDNREIIPAALRGVHDHVR